jgi:hypoxanthine phosphoribosyltransferase
MTAMVQIGYQEYVGLTADLCRQIANTTWRPDYIVGIARGGLIPAVYMSQYFDVPMHSLKVSLRHGAEDTESNLWMAEDAFGYVDKEERGDEVAYSNIERRKNILIVDDINDTGATFNWIRDDWQSGCLGARAQDIWNSIWGGNVRFAVLVNNEASSFKDINFSARTVNKADDPQWLVFPWEDWWKN